MSKAIVAILRAMAENYTDGLPWNEVDRYQVRAAADIIDNIPPQQTRDTTIEECAKVAETCTVKRDWVTEIASAIRDMKSTGQQPCDIPSPSYRDCPNMKEVGGGMEGERYRCAVCGKGYFLDYEDMK